MVQVARQRYTFGQYIDLEQMSPIKHEFLGGDVWAMAGGTPSHSAVAINVAALLSEQLRGRPCRVFGSDLRIRVRATGLGTYPDVSVVCDALEIDPEDPTRTTVVNPKLLVEILSPSTEAYDRGEKLEHYKRISSLEEVVLVAHDEPRVDLYRKQGDRWIETTTRSGDVELRSVGAVLPVAEIYRDPLRPA
jgi:Uma2 family endonuclease